MTNAPVHEPLVSSDRRARRCRIAGGVVMLLGLASAGGVYWLGSRAPDEPDDPSRAGFNRAEEQQMARLYGQQGQLFDNLETSLKQPGTQAVLIVAAAAGVAVGCLFFARILAGEAKPAGAPGVVRRED